MKSLKWYDFISINLYWLGLNIRNNAVGNYFMPYLVAIFVPAIILNTALGEMRLAGLVIAMLVQPAVGLLSDRSSSRFGRRRPFIFVGVLLDLVFLAFIALSWNYWALLVAILLIQVSGNISHGALQGLIPDLVPENQRGVASGVKAILELLPIVLMGFTVAKLIGAGHFTWAVISTGAALLVTMLLTIVLVKEQPLTEAPTAPLAPTMLRVLGMLAGLLAGIIAGLVGGGIVGGLVGLIAWPFTGSTTAWAIVVGVGVVVAMVVAVVAGVWGGSYATLGKEILQKPDFTWWVVNRLMFLAAITSIQGIAPYFLKFVFNITNEAAISRTGTLMIFIGIFLLASALPGGWLSDRFGRNRLIGLSGLLAAVGAIVLLTTVWIANMNLIYIAGIILGIATGLFNTANWALGTDLVPPGEAGRYLGVSNLAGAGAGIIGAGIGGPVADYLNNFMPGMGYFALFSAFAVLFALSAVSLRWVKISKHVQGS